jgi:hypothetical protein
VGKSVCLGRRRDGRMRQRLGWVGVLGYASGFLSLRPRICPHLLRLATKDYSDRLLAVQPECRDGAQFVVLDQLGC